jgi:hypothetical protein
MLVWRSGGILNDVLAVVKHRDGYLTSNFNRSGVEGGIHQSQNHYQEKAQIAQL